MKLISDIPPDQLTPDPVVDVKIDSIPAKDVIADVPAKDGQLGIDVVDPIPEGAIDALEPITESITDADVTKLELFAPKDIINITTDDLFAASGEVKEVRPLNNVVSVLLSEDYKDTKKGWIMVLSASNVL